MTWPWVVFGSIALFLLCIIIDTWLKMPYLHRQVGTLKLTARGDKAVDYVIEQAAIAEEEQAAGEPNPSDDYQRGFRDGKAETGLAQTLRDLPSVQAQASEIERLRAELELLDRRSKEPVGCNDWNQLTHRIEELRDARQSPPHNGEEQ